MKVMSRNFTMSEKILIGILMLFLVGLMYYRFVDQPVREAINAADTEYQEAHTELEALAENIARLEQIQGSMDELEEDGNLSWMGSYNNSKEEVKFLNDILAETLQYSISFAKVTRSGDQVRRSFTLQYRTNGYKAAQEIVHKLLQCKNRCLVSDFSCSIGRDGIVTMSQSATFYETMVGGVSDAALPKTSESTKR